VIILLLIGVLWGAVCGALPGVGFGLDQLIEIEKEQPELFTTA
jgi:hypothetical protein